VAKVPDAAARAHAAALIEHGSRMGVENGNGVGHGCR